MVAHERLTEPLVTMERVLEKPRSLSNLPAFLDLNGRILFFDFTFYKLTVNYLLKIIFEIRH